MEFSKIKKFGLGIAIIIVFNLFIAYGISTFYKAPQYSDFCPPQPMQPMPIKPGQPLQNQNQENYYNDCQKKFNDVSNLYRRNVFIIWIVVGILAIIGNFFIAVAPILSSSFLFAGVLSLIIGSSSYWSAMQDYLRFIILGIALIFLIFITYKKLEKKI